MTDLMATIKEDTVLTVEDDTKFLVHEGESYRIDRVGNGGVIVLTPFGEVTLPWCAFRWSGEDVWCGLAEVAS